MRKEQLYAICPSLWRYQMDKETILTAMMIACSGYLQRITIGFLPDIIALKKGEHLAPL